MTHDVAGDTLGVVELLEDRLLLSAVSFDHLTDAVLAKLVGTSASSVQAVREKIDAVTTSASTAPVYAAGLPTVWGDDVGIQTVQSTPLINLDDFRSAPEYSGLNGQGFSIVILDTGIDVNHPFFGPDLDSNGVADRIVYQWDYVNHDADASDDNGHGSNVASIACSQDATYTGMAPEANIIVFKVLAANGQGSFSYVESALQWVISNAVAYNIVSVNMSLGDGENYNTPQVDSPGISDELEALVAMNVIIVSAAGNDYYEHQAEGVSYPAADANSLAVGAVYDAAAGSFYYVSGAIGTSGVDRITPFSQRSTTMVDIFAPGAPITGADTSGGIVEYHGTSQAAPHIAGIAALAQQVAVRDLGRRLTQQEFRDLMRSTGVLIVDGDDEVDNVPNTGETFMRVDVMAMAQAINDLEEDPTVRRALADVSAAEDASDAVIDLTYVFTDADIAFGDSLTFEVYIDAPSAVSVVDEISQEIYSQIHSDLLYTHTGDDRKYGQGHDLARTNIATFFEQLGLTVSLEPFTYNGSTYYNVVATLPGTSRPGDVYIVGAHYDSTSSTASAPGADDNASGVAAVMEMARVLANHPLDATVKFIAFDREEQGMKGSYAYVTAHPGENILGMVSADMIAYNIAGANHDMVLLYDSNLAGQTRSELAAAFAEYANQVQAIVSSSAESGSDHHPFEGAGYDAALVIEYATRNNPYYHSPNDSVDSADYIDYVFATDITRAITGWVVGEATLSPATTLLTASLNGSLLTLDFLADRNGQASVTVRATDTTGRFVEDTFLVTVSPVNDAPVVADPLADLAAETGDPAVTIDLFGVFDDADISTDADWLTYTVTSTNSAVVSSSILYDARLVLEFTGSAGQADITVRATDQQGAYVEDTFTVVVGAVVPPVVRIIDDGDAGFSMSSSWNLVTGKGYQDDIRWMSNTAAATTATWTFSGLEAGVYRVMGTWRGVSTNATNAPFTVLDGTTVLGTVLMNQTTWPDDLTDAGGVWETIGEFTISGGTLAVRLSNDANSAVSADAIRIEKIGDPVQAPEVQVLEGSTDIPDNTGSVSFGQTPPGTSIVKTFTVRNVGTQDLTLTGPISVPSGFSVVQSFGSTTLAAGASTTFQVRLDATAEGSFSGQVSFGTNDSDENPFDFAVSGTVAVPSVVRIIDDGDAGFSMSSSWNLVTGKGYQDDIRWMSNTAAATTATWTFSGLEAGVYRVMGTWRGVSTNATNAPFTVLDGTTVLGTVLMNQTTWPDDLTDAGGVWETIGEFTISGGTLAVRLSNDANSAVSADAIRIEKVG